MRMSWASASRRLRRSAKPKCKGFSMPVGRKAAPRKSINVQRSTAITVTNGDVGEGINGYSWREIVGHCVANKSRIRNNWEANFVQSVAEQLAASPYSKRDGEAGADSAPHLPDLVQRDNHLGVCAMAKDATRHRSSPFAGRQIPRGRNQEADGSRESDFRARRHRQPGADLGRCRASAGADVSRSCRPRLARHAAGLFSRHRSRRCGM